MKIYNYKGIELDDADIEYLQHRQTVYLSLDGSNFNILNYVNEHKFLKWIKSGGYGKVYSGKYLFKVALNLLSKDIVAVKQIDVSTLCKHFC